MDIGICHCGTDKPRAEWFCADCDPWCEPGESCRKPAGYVETRRVHNHPPYAPMCNERRVDGQLRGACLNDDGSDR